MHSMLMLLNSSYEDGWAAGDLSSSAEAAQTTLIQNSEPCNREFRFSQGDSVEMTKTLTNWRPASGSRNRQFCCLSLIEQRQMRYQNMRTVKTEQLENFNLQAAERKEVSFILRTELEWIPRLNWHHQYPLLQEETPNSCPFNRLLSRRNQKVSLSRISNRVRLYNGIRSYS